MRISNLILSLFFCAIIFGGCSEKPKNLSINVLQNGKSQRAREGTVTLNKEPFVFIFSFQNVPIEADTSISVYYWASTDSDLEDRFEDASTIDEVMKNTSGSSSSLNNFYELIEVNNQGSHSFLEFLKPAGSDEATHSYSSLQRSGNRIDAYYKARSLMDFASVQTPGDRGERISITDLPGEDIFLYFSVHGKLPKNEEGIVEYGELEGHLVHLQFKE